MALRHWESNCTSLAQCALPVETPGPKTSASKPALAKTPASVLVGLACG